MSREQAARDLLADPQTVSSIVYLAARVMFGADLDTFEHETLRLDAKHREIQIDPQNWEELFAVLALRGSGSFAYDANVFENTVVVFNGGMPNIRHVQTPPPAHIAWAVDDASAAVSDILNEEISDFLDYEPVSYAAVSCLEHGYSVAPEGLEFCDERLACLVRNAEHREEVKKDESDGAFNAAHVHRERTRAVAEYLEQMRGLRDKQLSQLAARR